MAKRTRAPNRSEKWADDWPRLMAPEEPWIAAAVTDYLMSGERGPRPAAGRRLLRRTGSVTARLRHRISIQRGGPGSGHWGHKGRPGKVGGSLPSKNGARAEEISDSISIRARVRPAEIPGAEPIPKTAMQFWERWEQHEGTAEVLLMTTNKGMEPSTLAYTDLPQWDRAASWKATVARNLARDLGVSESMVSEFVAQWAATSADEKFSALALQRAASEVFGAPMPDHVVNMLEKMEASRRAALDAAAAAGEEGDFNRWNAAHTLAFLADSPGVPDLRSVAERFVHEQWLGKTAHTGARMTPEDLARMVREECGGRSEEEFAKDYLRAVYARTQRVLQEWGVEGVTVYRGIGVWGRKAAVPSADSTVPLGGNPLQSWTTDLETATWFADNGPGPDRPRAGSVVYAAYVPRERIFSLPFTGPGCLSEYEVIVIGGPGEKGVILSSGQVD